MEIATMQSRPVEFGCKLFPNSTDPLLKCVNVFMCILSSSPIIVVLVVTLAGEDVCKIHGNDGPLEIVHRASVETHDSGVLAWLCDHTIDSDISLGRDGIYIIKF